jgi:hypothetical protein
MSFFNFSIGADGKEALRVSGKWWLFLAVTVPLTLLVFAVWISWQQWRVRRKEVTLPLEFGDGLETNKERARRYSDTQKWHADAMSHAKATLVNVQRPTT